MMSCAAHEDRNKAIEATWAIPGLVRIFDAKEFGLYDNYEDLGHKFKLMIERISEHDNAFICDTDTYVSIPRLIASGFEYHDYIGMARVDWEPAYAYGGAGFWLSRKSMGILNKADWARFTHKSYPWAADMIIGAILSDAGINVHQDHRYTIYGQVLPTNDTITQHLSARGGFSASSIHEAHRKATQKDLSAVRRNHNHQRAS